MSVPQESDPRNSFQYRLYRLTGHSDAEAVALVLAKDRENRMRRWLDGFAFGDMFRRIRNDQVGINPGTRNIRNN